MPLNKLYKYNGQEWQGDFGYNMYDMPLRDYDPAIGRWVVQDPVIHHSQSTYSSFNGNPVLFADPSGGAGQAMIDNNYSSQYDDTGNKIFPDGFLPEDDDFFDRSGGATGETSDFDGVFEDDDNSLAAFNQSSDYLFEVFASTVVDNSGTIIDYIDDGDSTIYYLKRGGLIVGKQRMSKKYIVGSFIEKADLLEDFRLINGLLIDVSRLNASRNAPKNPNARIANCLLCSSRRCNGASHSSTSRAIINGVQGMTTPDALTVGAATHWIEKSPWGWFGAFAQPYLDDGYNQYLEYNEKLKKAKEKIKR